MFVVCSVQSVNIEGSMQHLRVTRTWYIQYSTSDVGQYLEVGYSSLYNVSYLHIITCRISPFDIKVE
jgi:hypothetical protein